jgi:hypothetical protein
MPQALGRRNVQTVVAEELADQAAAQRMKAEFPADVLLQALTDGCAGYAGPVPRPAA